MIREVKREDIGDCVNIIRQSFITVADEFGFTPENAPRFTAFATTEDRLIWQMDNENRLMYIYEQEGVSCGYYSLLMQENEECELNNLSVLPEYRHLGIGKKLLEHAYESARNAGCKAINIGIVEENVVLRRWYEQNGAVHVGTKKFDFFPFTCGYMRKEI
ncbi:GNAT family N-acetyltransferase [Butyrivibrio sp. LC3010]|uniref:GNAT family N-acetyltransferase n=1 Tax=Butyrivibrio sp. LC3010 TaxID=1280680 RepID=UPI000424EDF6|nr:GNAT family N-acetyltransferase [Butyrivibrio sp. LC3010]